MKIMAWTWTIPYTLRHDDGEWNAQALFVNPYTKSDRDAEACRCLTPDIYNARCLLLLFLDFHSPFKREVVTDISRLIISGHRLMMCLLCVNLSLLSLFRGCEGH